MGLIAKINWVDIFVAIIVLRISYVAFKDGLSHEIFPFCATLFIIVCALRYYGKGGSFIAGNIPRIPVALANFLSFTVLVIILGIVSKLVKIILEKAVKVEWHPLLERIGGLTVGLMRASVTVSLILAFLALMPLPYLQRSIRERSLTGMYFLRIGPAVYVKLARFMPTIKITGARTDKDLLMQNLASDKTMTARSIRKEANGVRAQAE